jgi:hypothetical protein
MDAGVALHSSPTWIREEGNYTTYAGPVYVYAPHEGIDWSGGTKYGAFESTGGRTAADNPSHSRLLSMLPEVCVRNSPGLTGPPM